MSDLSQGLHQLENTVESWLGHLPPEGQAALKAAVSSAQTAASTSIVVNSSALDSIWDNLEKGLEAVLDSAEAALLGPTASAVSIPLSNAAYEAIAAKGKSYVDTFIAARQAARPS